MALALALATPVAADAQATRREGGGADAAATARFQQQLRKLQAEKSELQTQNADLTRQLEESKQRLKSLEATNKQNEEALARYEEAVAAYKQRLEESFERIRQGDAQLLELAGLQRETAATLQQTRLERERVSGELGARTGELKDCEGKNLKLYEANVEMSERFEKKGAWDSLLQAEPFTGLKQVEVENILEEYRFRVEDLRRTPTPAPTSATGLPTD